MRIVPYDAIVVGGGHNGLVAAFYLARAGLQVIVLERREIVGGPCATQEWFPGYKHSFTNSPGSLEPRVVADMQLHRFGLRYNQPTLSMVQPFPDGRVFAGRRGKPAMLEEIQKFSASDARVYFGFLDYFTSFAKTIKVSVFEPPPTFAELAARLRTPEDEEAFGKILLGSIADLLDEWFESDEVKAVLGSTAIGNFRTGPMTPGTAFGLLRRPMSLLSTGALGRDDPRLQPLRGSTGLPVGGMGAITQAMEASIKSLGVHVRTHAEVTHIRTDDGKVTGVALSDGEEIDAAIVLSNLNPKSTLLDLVGRDQLDPEFRARVDRLTMRGSQFKVVLALDDMPRFAAASGDHEMEQFAACQFRIAPSLEYMERAWDDLKYGRWSSMPMFWGLTPSVIDPSVAPPGRHLMSLNVYHAPYKLREGNWSSERDRFGQRCVDLLAEYIPNLKDSIVDYSFWSPEDFESELGLLEAQNMHGDMLPGRNFGLRPLAGWSHYRTPLQSLYLCGSGAWPGGSVTGAPGHNASQQVLRDLAQGRVALRRSADMAATSG